MKKFLTVLLVIAVMFTFSFGSAFAAVSANSANVVKTNAEATKMINDKVDGFIAAVDAAAAKLISDYTAGAVTGISKEAYTNALADEVQKEKLALETKRVNALNALATAERTVADANANKVVNGYVFQNTATDTPVTGDGYVDLETILDSITSVDFANTYKVASVSGEFKNALAVEEFGLVKEATIAAIAAIDASIYSSSAVTASTITAGTISVPAGVKHNVAAASAKNQALSAVDAITLAAGDGYDQIIGSDKKADLIVKVYKVNNKGTAGEATTGYLATVLGNLTKVSAELTTDKKIEYAQTAALAQAKKTIEDAKASAIAAENAKIFAQQVSSNPNQTVIDNAQKAIEDATARYDALLEVWTYRLTNADYTIDNAGGVSAYNDKNGNGTMDTGEQLAGVGLFTGNNFDNTTSGAYTTEDVTLMEAPVTGANLLTALAIVGEVDRLEAQAEALKATIAVDGNTYIDIDDVLADEIYNVYMTAKASAGLDPYTSDYEAHNRIHSLIGAADKKVTIEGTKYDTVAEWEDKADDGVYDETKADEVYDLAYATKVALKKAKTVSEAEKIFLDAYAEFDAIMTDAEHTALFQYGGELYEAYPKAVKEIKAYIDYKKDLMGTDYPAADATALKNYFAKADNTGVLYVDVYSLDDLNAKLAEAKATVDALKTGKELKAEDLALSKKVLAIKAPVTLEQKDEIIALYRDIDAFDDYCNMVGYSNTTFAYDAVTTTEGLITKYVKDIAALEKKAMDKIVDEIYKDGKITLDDRENVEAVADAASAYKSLYVYDLEVNGMTSATFSKPAAGTTASYYEDAIFDLDVAAAAQLVRALPSEGATAAQLKEARDAVDALGFDGICALVDAPYNGTELTKLNRLEQNSANAAIISVETLKITASSTAKKGSITVKWTAEGDMAAADGFEIYRSTKHNSGFGKTPIFTTTKTTYKNTKGLKTGTRYYYKVRAYKVVDGKKIYSDWSNKARRIAK